MTARRTALYALSSQGLLLARRLAQALDAEIFAPQRLVDAELANADLADADLAGQPGATPFASLAGLVARTFSRYPRHVFVGATGIAVRAIAPHLQDKTSDPAVAVLDLAARFAVSLVSGHAGGANALARELARLTGATAVITTGTDARGLPGVDALAAERGMAVENAGAVKAVSAALLEGRPVQCFDPEGRLLDFDDSGGLLVPTQPEAWNPEAPGVWCHWRAGGGFPGTFRAYPRCLCLGLGCRKGVEKGQILAHVAQVFAQQGLAQQSIAAVGTATIKQDDPGLCAAAAALGPEVVFFTPEALARVEAAGQSETVKRRTGTGSVCEAAALLLSGAGTLLAPKMKTSSVTCAVGLRAAPGRETEVRSAQVQKIRGRITVVGLGPGDTALLPPLARQALERAAAIVGYKGYIELLEPELLAGRRVLSTGMTGEVERCAAAIDLALEGVETAVVSSGDAGVYAMAGLVLELLEARGLLEAVDYEVVPGIPALCAAAALLGAPLMHDFAVISLSDLLTPWAVIEKRLAAAAAADFVVVLYNPRSVRRKDQLPQALAALAAHRPGSTPVGLVKRAFRPGQEVLVGTLDGLDPELVDMQSILVVGNASTRMAGGRMLTPRGYAGKYGLDADGSAQGS